MNNAKTTAECPGFQLARDLRTGNHQKVKHASGWAETPGCDSHQRCARCRGAFAVALAGPLARGLPPCGWKCERMGGSPRLRFAPKVRALARPSAATFTAPFARGDASLLEHLHPLAGCHAGCIRIVNMRCSLRRSATFLTCVCRSLCSGGRTDITTAHSNDPACCSMECLMTMLSDTSLTLLERVKRGEVAAWSEFCGHCATVLRRWSGRMGLQAADVDDLIQDTLLIVIGRIRLFQRRGTGSFRAWLRVIAWRCWCDAVARAAKQPPGGDRASAKFCAGQDFARRGP